MRPASSRPEARGRAASTIDSAEIDKFERMATEWWDPDGKFRPLHKFGPVRLGYIRDIACSHFNRDPKAERPLAGLRLLDIGCGGGLLSEPMARLGADVAGVDPVPTNIEVARRHAEAAGLEIDYRATTAEALIDEGAGRFDIVLAMEVVEHVADLDTFITLCAAHMRPRALLLISTINRTAKAFALAIVGAEYLLRWLPHGTHDYAKLVRPDELEFSLAKAGLNVIDKTGVRYEPFSGRWSRTADLSVNYLVAAERPSAA